MTGLRRRHAVIVFFAMMHWPVATLTAHTQTKRPSAARSDYDAAAMMEIFNLPNTLPLAEPYDLRVRFKGKLLGQFLLDQRYTYRIEEVSGPLAAKVRGSDQGISVKPDDQGNAVIRIVPMRLGPVMFDFRGVLSDGRLVAKSVTISIVESARKAESLEIGAGRFPDEAISMSTVSLERINPHNDLKPRAYYAGIKEPLEIDARAVHYAVRSSGVLDVLRIDPSTGNMTQLRVGEAIVEATFAGATARTCINVVKLDDQVTRLHSHCEDLLSSGNRN